MILMLWQISHGVEFHVGIVNPSMSILSLLHFCLFRGKTQAQVRELNQMLKQMFGSVALVRF